MAITVRPPLEGDLAALTLIDAAYAATHDLETLVTPGTLRFFGRTEHSFVAQSTEDADGGPVGFVFAQAVWSGERPQVIVARLATTGSSDATVALVKALVKSAYDSGVYDLLTRVPPGDAEQTGVLRQEAFFEDPLVQYVRVLGSRGVAASERHAAALRGENDRG